MKRLIVIFTIALSPLLFTSCESRKELDSQIEFFKKGTIDPLIIGTWKRDLSPADCIQVIDFFPNGEFGSNQGTHYFRYCTKDGILLLLRTGAHSHNPLCVEKTYKVVGNKLYLNFKGTDYTTAETTYTKL